MVIIILLMFTACSPPVTPETPNPSIQSINQGVPAPTPLSVLTGDISIQLLDQAGNAISQGQVELSGPGIESNRQISDENGSVLFQKLPLSEPYDLNISIQGQLLLSRYGLIFKNKNGKAAYSENMAIPQKIQQGKILDTSRHPLPNAVISNDTTSTTSDQEGFFQWASSMTIPLTISKQGYQTITIQKPQEEIQLAPQSTSTQVLLEGSKRPLGSKESLQKMQQLSQALLNNGFAISTNLDDTLPSLNSVDILLIPSPLLGYSSEERQHIQTFVSKGGKLIVTGEWSGFGGFNASHTNVLLLPYGISLGSDTLREGNGGTLKVTRFTQHPLTEDIQQLTLYQATSVRMTNLASNGNIYARTSPDGFRILSQGAFGILAATLYGNGKVIVVGDTSFLTDEDSDNNGIFNLQEGDNLKLALHIFEW